jgi:hypothetical protein
VLVEDNCFHGDCPVEKEETKNGRESEGDALPARRRR